MNKCVYCGSEGLEDVVIYVDYACKAGGGGGDHKDRARVWLTRVFGFFPFYCG